MERRRRDICNYRVASLLKTTFLKLTNGIFGKNYRFATPYNIPNYFKNHHAEFELNRTVLICLNYQ